MPSCRYLQQCVYMFGSSAIAALLLCLIGELQKAKERQAYFEEHQLLQQLRCQS